MYFNAPVGDIGKGMNNVKIPSCLSLISPLPEGLVQPPVEEGIVAGGGHGEGVAGEEGDVVPLPAVDAVVEVLRDVDDVEREPAEDEDHQNGHQEAAPSPVPRSLRPPPRQVLAGKARQG